MGYTRYPLGSGAQGVTGPSGGAQGETGLQGITGIQGSRWFVGIGVPSVSVGSDGDFYIDDASGTYYHKESGSWIPKGQIVGAQGTTGLQGPQGNIGSTGVQGQTGLRGSQGDQGATGVKGSTGLQGPTGVQGAQGTTGSQGQQGLTGVGAQGVTGLVGQTGAQGTTGVGLQGFTGLTGATGVRGLTGLQGQTGVQGSRWFTGASDPDNSLGVDGDMYLNTTTGVYFRKISSTWVLQAAFSGLTGMQGFTGIQGQTGVKGATGVQGTQGNTGVIGPQGQTGSQGQTGPLGSTGLQGPTGVQGDQGQTGIQGQTGASILGATGLQGPQGDTGIQGVTGPLGGGTGLQGPTGVKGDTGIQGLTGVIGLQGPKGTTGPAGAPQGVTGLPGVGFTGVQGVTGSQGQTGVTGNTGPSVPGYTGLQGIQGDTGIQGNTGAQGLLGLQGNIGATGLQGLTGPQGAGATGLQGIQGQTGIQGAAAAQGNTGVQGATGVQGLQGQTGAGVQGATGIQGPTGLQGATGTRGLQGTTGATPSLVAPTTDYYTQPAVNSTTQIAVSYNPFIIGEEIVLLDNGGSNNYYQYLGITGPDANTLVIKNNFVGNPAGAGATLGGGPLFTISAAPGPQGLTGIRGVTGAGVQGATGVAGVQGDTGIQGATGIKGVTGIQGLAGTVGAALYGEVYVDNNAVAIACASNANHYGLTGIGWVVDELNGCSGNNLNGALTTLQTASVQTLMQCSFSTDKNNATIDFTVYKNGTAIPGHDCQQLAKTSGDMYTCSIIGIVSAATNDVFDVRVNSSVNSTNLTVSNIEFNLTAVAGAQGATGLQGNQGSTGPAGGPVGATGIQGVTGPSGGGAGGATGVFYSELLSGAGYYTGMFGTTGALYTPITLSHLDNSATSMKANRIIFQGTGSTGPTKNVAYIDALTTDGTYNQPFLFMQTLDPNTGNMIGVASAGVGTPAGGALLNSAGNYASFGVGQNSGFNLDLDVNQKIGYYTSAMGDACTAVRYNYQGSFTGVKGTVVTPNFGGANKVVTATDQFGSKGAILGAILDDFVAPGQNCWVGTNGVVNMKLICGLTGFPGMPISGLTGANMSDGAVGWHTGPATAATWASNIGFSVGMVGPTGIAGAKGWTGLQGALCPVQITR